LIGLNKTPMTHRRSPPSFAKECSH